MECDKDNYCIICPYRYCIDEDEIFQRLVEKTKDQVERWGLHWISIYFESGDIVALKAFERYRQWLREYGFEGNEPSYKEWIMYSKDTNIPVTECGCHNGTFYFKPIRRKSNEDIYIPADERIKY